jgi:DNA modification methylase
MNDWRERRTQVFLSKPTMYGAGINLQQSHTMIFAGIGFKFADLIQAIHRIYRFLQMHPCEVHFVYTENERQVRETILRKWAQHRELTGQMTTIIKEFGLTSLHRVEAMTRAMGIPEPTVIETDHYRIAHNDTVLETKKLETDSIGLILTSIPFSTQYEYSPNYADFGHTDDNDHFFEQMDYLTPDLLRVLKPGRFACIHVKDRVVPGGMTGLGFQTVYPFHVDAIRHYTKHGFAYMGMVTIVTDVVRENNQTYRLGWTEQCKDATKMGVGMPEYLLLFRKPQTDTTRSYTDDPVQKVKPLVFASHDDADLPSNQRKTAPMKAGDKRASVRGSGYSRARWQIDAHAFERSSGDRLLTPDELDQLPHEQIFKWYRQHGLTQVYDYESHVGIGEQMEESARLPVTFMLLQPPSWSPEVWTDVARMRCLNGEQKHKGKQMHLCPMQYDIADRTINRLSNPGDRVYDPFGGLMSVPYRAIKLGRYGMGTELSPSYFADGAFYCESAVKDLSQPSLFDALEIEAAAAADGCVMEDAA